MQLSIIIPTWCEAAAIADTISAARACADEIIVVDAGGDDGTEDVARGAGATVVRGAMKGRGPQMDAGARAASGDVLLFLHADARLPPGARSAMESALADPDIGGGNFGLRFVPRTMLGDVFGAVNFVRRFAGIYYGDSAIFVRREVYAELGGFRPLPLFEDYEFARRLERSKKTCFLWKVPVEVSDRRYAHQPLRTVAICDLSENVNHDRTRTPKVRLTAPKQISAESRSRAGSLRVGTVYRAPCVRRNCAGRASSRLRAARSSTRALERTPRPLRPRGGGRLRRARALWPASAQRLPEIARIRLSQ